MNHEQTKGICLYHADIHTGYTHIEDGFVLIRAGVIENVYSRLRFDHEEISRSYEMIDIAGRMIFPGYIDTHTHGLRGYGVEEGQPEQIAGMARVLPEYGVTAFIPTISVMTYEETLRAIRAIVEAPREPGSAQILGMHLEGPFISREKKGIQRESCIRDVSVELLKEYWELSEGTIISMTVAPELKGMRELVLEAQKLGITLLAGHSNATYEQMVEGIEAGILHSTHFFNAMRSMHHRDPGVVGAILIHPEISCELIADGVHVHPALVSFLVKEKHAGKIALITDSLRPTGLPEGEYLVKGDRVSEQGGVFCRIEDGTIAGSALTMDRGVANMIEWGIDVSEVVSMASLNPARIYDLEKRYGSLLPGRRADLVICDRQYQIQRTLIGGRTAYAREAGAWTI
ncbi:MAG: N-acetylglucosamine-6-phosphate deacetylase [Spirochaetia bacterium]|nr:N-acetylglucosamine-6-phosphate deacetylase [Spirochaetia bacterium]